MRSLNEMVRQIAGLVGTRDVSDWEGQFIESVYERSNKGANTAALSDKQVGIVERIWSKHFA